MHRTNLLSYIGSIGLILILSACTKNESSTQPHSGGIDVDISNASAPLQKAKDNAEFESSLKAYLRAMPDMAGVFNGGDKAAIAETRMDAVAPGLATTAAAGSAGGGAASSNTSSTNTIEAGVDESDFLKTDGNHIYLLKNPNRYPYYFGSRPGDVVAMSFMPTPPTSVRPQTIEIYKIDSTTAKATLKKTLVLENESNASALYLRDGANNVKQLIVVTQRANNASTGRYQMITGLIAFDVTSVENAKQIWKYEIEGSINTTRVIGGRLYAVSRRYFVIPNFVPWDRENKSRINNEIAIEKLKASDVLPKTWLNNEATNDVIARDCAVPTIIDPHSYFDMGITSVVSIDLDDPTQANGFCTPESSSNIYVSQNSIYLTKPTMREQKEITVVHKLKMDNGNILYRASGAAPGSLGWRNLAFRIDEENDTVRVLTTSHQFEVNPMAGTGFVQVTRDIHHLYILAESTQNPGVLEKLSQLPNDKHPEAIGKPGETIYGVRFSGDYGYVVTFQKTDPLYVINLKEPTNPYIEGKLEMPGYSDYIHPLSENLVLGIGKDAIPSGGFALFQGLKIGLFDVSDKTKPTIISEYKLGERGSDTPLFYDYKAFTIQTFAAEGRWRIAFPTNVYKNASTTSGNSFSYSDWDYCGLSLFDIKKSTSTDQLGITQAGTLKIADASSNKQYCSMQNPRGALIDDAVYFTESGDLWSTLWTNSATVFANNKRAQMLTLAKINKQKWTEKNVVSATFNYRRSCSCTFDEADTFNLTSLYGRVSAVRNVTKNIAVTNIVSGEFYSIEELFYLVERSLEADDDINVKFNEIFGYPARIEIKSEVNGTQKTAVFEVSNLSIVEHVPSEKLVVLVGRIITDWGTRSYVDANSTLRYLINTTDGPYIELYNSTFVQKHFGNFGVNSSTNYVVNGYWVDTPNLTTSKFIVTKISTAI